MMDNSRDVRRGRRRRSGHNIWRSYSDMMAGLLLLFILVMAVLFLEAQESYDGLLESQKLQDELNEKLQQQKLALDQQESEMEQQKKLLENQQKIMKNQQQTLEDQKKTLEDQQQKIDKIIGVKASLISDLKEEFKKSSLDVRIDEETGAISFASDILFGYNESDLTEEGREMLSQMLPIYCGILLEKNYREFLSQVVIDGFADTVGSYEFNLELSQRRAFAVAKYLLQIERDLLGEDDMTFLEERLSANGRSKSNPVLTAENEIDMMASRRVEVKFRLKDEEMIQELQNILNQQQ